MEPNLVSSQSSERDPFIEIKIIEVNWNKQGTSLNSY